MSGEIAVAQSKPRLAAESVEFAHHSPGLTVEPPTELVVVETGQGVGDGVQIGADGESVKNEVVADVHHGRQVGRIVHVAQGAQQWSRTHATTQNRYHLRNLRGAWVSSSG